MPAVTIVAACISADTGVGPAMASGSQMCSGNWADLPIAPKKRSRATASATAARAPSPSTAALDRSVKRKLPIDSPATTAPRISPTSATLLVRKALLPAITFSFCSQ